jgi:hypothetical protein
VASYVIFGLLALFGVTAGFIAFFATRWLEMDINLRMTSLFGPIMPFSVAAVAGFTFLGVTQETASLNPVNNKRAVWYTVAVTLIAFGFFTMPLAYYGSNFTAGMFGNVNAIFSIIAMMIPFVLPGVGLLVFLILTEKDRLKPWAKSFQNKTVEMEMAIWQDSQTAGRFGLYSGAIWMFAIGVFLLLGFLIGFKFSWMVFIFAVAFQLLVQGFMYNRKKS